MNITRKLPAVALLALAAATAGAQSDKSRGQVRKEFDEARRNGDLMVSGELGLKENELVPGRYPARATVGKSREQVNAELAQARLSGDIIATGELGLTANQLRPSSFPASSVVAGKTREQVKAELAEARRDGDLMAAGELGLTLREEYPYRYRNTTPKAQQAATIVQPTAPATIAATR
jgi:lambda repressor-like predicted transcriptional regulator